MRAYVFTSVPTESRCTAIFAAAVDPSEEDKRRAIKHWNEGIKRFQAHDYTGARDEWLLCMKFDPACDECSQGLKRIDNTFGGGR